MNITQEQPESKTCNKCKKDKPLDEFHKDSHIKSGRKGTCSTCCNGFKQKMREKKLAKGEWAKHGKFYRTEVDYGFLNTLTPKDTPNGDFSPAKFSR